MKYHIITYGCQMNQNDSERIAYLFDLSKNQNVPENDADILIINACSVRGRVVDRLKAKIDKHYKTKKIILTGCVLDKDKEKLTEKIDCFLSIEDLYSWHTKIDVLEKIKPEDTYFKLTAKREKPIAYVPIMTGCNNFCSYCAVPYVRGREKSRKLTDIVKEVEKLVFDGFKEIWLLGQNVNSYNFGKTPDFADLLKEIDNIDGDFWLRFTSSHPKDFSEKLIFAIKNGKKTTNYLNLPIQSGDDDVLKLMNRPYSIADYKNIIKKLKKEIPDITLSTDIIVGFPGESNEAFENTKKLIQEISYDMAYIARYSPRPGTASSLIEDSISDDIKKKREEELTKILKESSEKNNQKMIGKTIYFLPINYKNGFIFGKTKCYKTIKVAGKKEFLHKFQKAKIIEADSFSLKGQLL